MRLLSWRGLLSKCFFGRRLLGWRSFFCRRSFFGSRLFKRLKAIVSPRCADFVAILSWGGSHFGQHELGSFICRLPSCRCRV